MVLGDVLEAAKAGELDLLVWGQFGKDRNRAESLGRQPLDFGIDHLGKAVPDLAQGLPRQFEQGRLCSGFRPMAIVPRPRALARPDTVWEAEWAAASQPQAVIRSARMIELDLALIDEEEGIRCLVPMLL